jgi:hypothetical protein
VPAAFFEPDGDRYIPSELTRGPWDPDSQHAGPPAALVAREIERLPVGDGPPRQVGRITYEILRPVPIAPLRVEARIVRPGRSVEMVEASLADERGDVVRARGWRVRAGEVATPPELSSRGGAGRADSGSLLVPGAAPPGPDEGREVSFFPTGQDVGYHTAMDYRFIRGEFNQPGPATAWMRMRQSLVAGEDPSPLQRIAIAADSGNGISATLDFRQFIFINVDLTLHLLRYPTGEWVCLDSITIAEPTGVGITDTALFDEHGPIGRAAQTLLVAERS